MTCGREGATFPMLDLGFEYARLPKRFFEDRMFYLENLSTGSRAVHSVRWRIIA